MTRQGIVEGSAPTKHSVRVNFFQRDPGGTTIFALEGDNGVASQSATEHDGGVTAQR